MDIKVLLKKSGWVSIIESLIFAILGIILVCKPNGIIKLITWILGSIFILIGVIKIIKYFVTKGNNEFFNYELVYGLTSIVIGIVAMVYMNIIGSIFRIIIGVWILYTSFVRINSSLQMRKLTNRIWICSLILALIMFVCGLYVIINSNAIIISIGVIMIMYAIIDIVENLIFMKNIKDIL